MATFGSRSTLANKIGRLYVSTPANHLLITAAPTAVSGTPFDLTVTALDAVKRHLKAIEAKWDTLIRRKIEEQLTHEPDVETRNRKPFRRRPAPFGADWEIRFGPDNRFRVLYKIVEERREVYVLAIGVKQGNRLLFGGQEIDL